MKKIIRFLVTLLVIAGALAILKPTSDNFESWLKKDSARKRGNAKGDNVVEKLVDKGVTTATQLQILATYRYNDYRLVAVVEANANGEEYKYIGIATIWIPLP